MYLVDTHTHIFADEFNSDIDEVILRASESGVKKFYLPNIDSETIPQLKALAEKYPNCCFPMMGLHPTSIKENYQDELAVIYQELTSNPYIAIGEIGIDLYWDKTFRQEQIKVFEEQLRWSIEFDLPGSIHVRKAFPDVFDSLRRVGAEKLRGIFHCFGGSQEVLKTALEFKNFLFGINGVITYKNAHICEYIQAANLERIVLETDAPYLTPVPYRGKRNEPAYLIHIVQKLAEVYGVSEETIIKQTTLNAEQLFELRMENGEWR